MNYLKYKLNYLSRILIGITITSVIIPLVITDIWVEIYHHICFRLYRIPLIQRSRYIRIDRHKLTYLSFWQKWFCIYCGYANGAVHYWTQIAAQTEKYWCGIQHKKRKDFYPPAHHAKLNFVEYGNESEFRNVYEDAK